MTNAIAIIWGTVGFFFFFHKDQTFIPNWRVNVILSGNSVWSPHCRCLMYVLYSSPDLRPDHSSHWLWTEKAVFSSVANWCFLLIVELDFATIPPQPLDPRLLAWLVAASVDYNKVEWVYFCCFKNCEKMGHETTPINMCFNQRRGFNKAM